MQYRPNIFQLLPALLALVLGAGSVLQAEEATAEKALEAVVEKAKVDFKEQKYDDVIAALANFNSKFPDNPIILNLMGAAYTKKKDFPRATSFFKKAMEKNPDFFPAEFNVGEVLFLSQQYPEALVYFKEMLQRYPRNGILQFKCFLCELESGNLEQAEKWLPLIAYPGDTPAWFYAQAAWALKNGKPGKASEYLASAKLVFSGKTDLFDETFQDMGYKIK